MKRAVSSCFTPHVSLIAFPSSLLPAISHADTERHRVLRHPRKSRGGHHLAHPLTRDKRIDALRQVLVGAGLVAADPGGGAGEDFAKIKVVEAAEDGIRRQG